MAQGPLTWKNTNTNFKAPDTRAAVAALSQVGEGFKQFGEQYKKKKIGDIFQQMQSDPNMDLASAQEQAAQAGGYDLFQGLMKNKLANDAAGQSIVGKELQNQRDAYTTETHAAARDLDIANAQANLNKKAFEASHRDETHAREQAKDEMGLTETQLDIDKKRTDAQTAADEQSRAANISKFDAFASNNPPEAVNELIQQMEADPEVDSQIYTGSEYFKNLNAGERKAHEKLAEKRAERQIMDAKFGGLQTGAQRQQYESQTGKTLLMSPDGTWTSTEYAGKDYPKSPDGVRDYITDPKVRKAMDLGTGTTMWGGTNAGQAFTPYKDLGEPQKKMLTGLHKIGRHFSDPNTLNQVMSGIMANIPEGKDPMDEIKDINIALSKTYDNLLNWKKHGKSFDVGNPAGAQSAQQTGTPPQEVDASNIFVTPPRPRPSGRELDLGPAP